MKNIKKSLAAKKAVKAKKKQCYYNCYRVMNELPELASATYVEGFANNKSFVFEHAWLELDEEIIDPTLPERELIYFPGIRADGIQKLSAAIVDKKFPDEFGKLPLFYRYGWGGVDHPEFLAARDAAYKFR